MARSNGLDFDNTDLRGSFSQEGWLDRAYLHTFPSPAQDRVRDLVFSVDRRREARARDAISRSEKLAGLLCEMESTKAFLDTTKHAAQIRFLSRHGEMPLKVVALVRDGRGTVSSLMKWYGYSFESAVSRWIHWIKLLRYSTRCVDQGSIFWARLEDLSDVNAPSVQALFRFCGVSADAPLDFSTDRRHVIGNEMRKTFNGEVRRDESWRRRLSPEQLRHFERTAGPLNESLGYGR